MRKTIFRILAGLLGAGLVLLGVPASKYAPTGFWPQWVYVITPILMGAIFIIFAITGRAWPSFYKQDVFKKDDDANDR